MRPPSLPAASRRLLPLLLLTASCAAAPRGGDASVLPPGFTFPSEPDKGSVTMFAVTRHEDLARCHRDFVLRKAPVSGRTVIEFTIRPDGAVEGAHVVETTLDDQASIDCMVKSVAAWRTPFRPALARTFRYPYATVAEDLSPPGSPR